MSTMSTTPPPPTTDAPRPRRSLGTRLFTVLAVVIGLGLVLTGLDRLTRETTTDSRTFHDDLVSAIAVDGAAADVLISAVPSDEITVKTRRTTGLWDDAGVDIRVDGTTLVLTSECRPVGFSSCRVAFDVRVPADLAARVAIDTTAGDIDLTGVTGDVTVHTTAGSVRLVDFGGRSASIDATAGTIEVDAGAATRSLDLDTTAGSIDVQIDDQEPLRVSTDAKVGKVDVSVNRAEDAARAITARTLAGEITVRGR